ncbi:MAG: Na-K-Cl cotransporter [Ignavibacteria bacterium]|jgi:amino acid transporter
MKSSKFGTFGGVFTPSILTILGVIMYLRLPWIIGQAGLFATIAIILIAHLISITTGLSVSSIATDKKVKTGGTYYIISRSLGLPIGGTLGLALFVGLSFSVSLYLIGFSESFLGYWGIGISKTGIRITGTLILLVVSGVTFVGAKLAIKAQYYIMTAIVLSLVSIALGKHDFTPTEPLLFPGSTTAPFILLFGIFFPAVTGFEAGVSMSGDLKDPKKSIPRGTISAITVGLLVYILLVFFYSYTVSSEVLVNDPTVLLHISFIPELVIAGIWGATLSSAFGSILSAPRILQATAKDRITPRIFAKGVGQLNEPRNALILSFIIAEAGILIGELDVIARIVSIFFITTYGILNLSAAIENWASSDYYPEFKIPIWVSLLGSAACFIVMIQLDFLAMIGATTILGLIFFLLQRKEIKLKSGDTWGGFWEAVVRYGLIKLKTRTLEWRNWRPNIILFSGGSYARPYLLETAKLLAGKMGLISNFDLIENNSTSVLFTKAGQSVKPTIEDSEGEEGVFTRRQECRDVYEGMEVIASIYGFSSIEPNTILMGWAKEAKEPLKFARLIESFNKLDYNSLFLEYNDEQGFGKKNQIDIWWRGAGNNFSLALTLARFITSNDEWRDAGIRLLTIKDDLSSTRVLENEASRVLRTFRLDATIEIIDNTAGDKSTQQIFKDKSQSADLSLFGIPSIDERNAREYITNINKMLEDVGTTLLVNASSYFKEISSAEES